MTTHTWDPVTIAPRLQAMMARWAENRLSERASLQPFIRTVRCPRRGRAGAE